MAFIPTLLRGVNWLGILGAFLVAITALAAWPTGASVSAGTDIGVDTADRIDSITRNFGMVLSVESRQSIASTVSWLHGKVLALRGITDLVGSDGSQTLLLTVWAGAFAIVGFAMTGVSRIIGYTLATLSLNAIALPMTVAAGIPLPIDLVVVGALAAVGLLASIPLTIAAHKEAREARRRAEAEARGEPLPEPVKVETPTAKRKDGPPELTRLAPLTPEPLTPEPDDGSAVAEAMVTDAVPVADAPAMPAMDAIAAVAEEEADGEGPADITDAVPIDGIQAIVAEEARMAAEAGAGSPPDMTDAVPIGGADEIAEEERLVDGRIPSFESVPLPEDVTRMIAGGPSLGSGAPADDEADDDGGAMITDHIPESFDSPPAPEDIAPIGLSAPADEDEDVAEAVMTDSIPMVGGPEVAVPHDAAPAMAEAMVTDAVPVAESESDPLPLPPASEVEDAEPADDDHEDDDGGPHFPVVPSAPALKKRVFPDAGETILKGESIRRVFQMGADGLEVLRGVDVQIKRSEILVILGASGAGKSTLLHILGLLDTPTAGRILYHNEDLARLTTEEQSNVRNRSFGFVFQFYHLLPEFTALENVLMPRMIRFGPGHYLGNRAEYVERAHSLLEALGLRDRMRHRPSQLSGGERQRVAIARALINDPEIVFCDEPTGNLDSRTAAEIHETLQGLNEDQGQTFVIVTHNERMAESIGHRHRWMHDGLMYLTRDHYVSARDRSRNPLDPKDPVTSVIAARG